MSDRISGGVGGAAPNHMPEAAAEDKDVKAARRRGREKRRAAGAIAGGIVGGIVGLGPVGIGVGVGSLLATLADEED